VVVRSQQQVGRGHQGHGDQPVLGVVTLRGLHLRLVVAEVLVPGLVAVVGVEAVLRLIDIGAIGSPAVIAEHAVVAVTVRVVAQRVESAAFGVLVGGIEAAGPIPRCPVGPTGGVREPVAAALMDQPQAGVAVLWVGRLRRESLDYLVGLKGLGG
jgi:hypothetical protein